MARKKNYKKRQRDVVATTLPGTATAELPKPGRYSRLWKALCILPLLLFIVFTIRFYRQGSSGYPVTIVFYLVLLTVSLGYIRNRTIRINAVLIILSLFAMESWLRISKRGMLNYTERNASSVFEHYYSLGYGDKKYHNGLYVNEPNITYANDKLEYQYPHAINELGFRERPMSDFIGLRNILVLGDSFTEGAGAPADSTGPASLRFFLRQYGYPQEVYNAGVSGSDLFFSYRVLERLGPELKPELVILHLNNSDIFDVIVRGGDERFTGKGYHYRIQKWWEYPFSFSYILRHILIGAFHTDPNDYYNPEAGRYAMEQIAGKIGDYVSWCDRHGARFLLVNVPNPKEFQHQDFFFEGLLDQPRLPKGIPYIYLRNDILDLIDKQGGSVWNYYYPLDQHLRPVGYWAWGEVVAHDIRQLGMLDKAN